MELCEGVARASIETLLLTLHKGRSWGLAAQVAQFAAELERYGEAIEVYEAVARASVENNLLKYSAKGYLLNAGICQLCSALPGERSSSLPGVLTGQSRGVWLLCPGDSSRLLPAQPRQGSAVHRQSGMAVAANGRRTIFANSLSWGVACTSPCKSMFSMVHAAMCVVPLFHQDATRKAPPA